MRILVLLVSIFATGFVKAGAFDSVKTIDASQRIAAAHKIYKDKIKGADSVFAISEINSLISISHNLDDKLLQCFGISLLADYYARIRGFNSESTRLHEQAITIAKQEHIPLAIGICNYRMGRYYYNFKKYPHAFECLLRADDYFKTPGYKGVPDRDEILYFMAGIYYESGNYDMAESYLQDIQRLTLNHPYIKKQSLNTLALISRQRKDTNKALYYFERTLDAALTEPDSAWVGISYANIGAVHYMRNNYGQAYPLFEKSGRLSKKYKEWAHVYMSLLYLARIEIIRGQMHSAEKKISEAIALHSIYNTLPGQKLLYETQAMYYEAIGQTAAALKMQKQLVAVKDSIAVNRDQKAYQEIQLRLEMEKHLGDISKLEAKTRAEAFKRNGIIAILALSLIVLLLWYRNYRVKARSNAAILQADKLRAEEKLKYARQLLQNFTENTKQKNDLIVQFASELDKLKTSLAGQQVYTERLERVEKFRQSNILSTEEWNTFQELFGKVHKGFFKRLAEKAPSLSVEDIRLVILIRLGISVTEMANMMGISVPQLNDSKLNLSSNLKIESGGSVDELIKGI